MDNLPKSEDTPEETLPNTKTVFAPPDPLPHEVKNVPEVSADSPLSESVPVGEEQAQATPEDAPSSPHPAEDIHATILPTQEDVAVPSAPPIHEDFPAPLSGSTPPSPKSHIILYILLSAIALGLFLIAFVLWSNTREKNVGIKAPSDSSLSQEKTTAVVTTPAYVFNVVENNTLTFYTGDTKGNKEKLYETVLDKDKTSFDAYKVVASPDKKKIVYVTGHNSFHFLDIATKKDSQIPFDNNAGEHMDQFSFTPSGEEILFVTSLPAANSMENYSYKLLNIATGGVTKVAQLDKGLYGFSFHSNTRENLLYIFAYGQCAPGPCYASTAVFNGKTKQVSPTFNADKLFGHRLFSFDQSGENIITSNNSIDVLASTPVVGKIEKYAIQSGQTTTLLEKNQRVLTGAKSISDTEILYEDKPVDAEGNTTEWDILNSTNKTIKKAYSGTDLGELHPLSPLFGVYVKVTIGKKEVGVLDFSMGKTKSVFSTNSQIGVVKL